VIDFVACEPQFVDHAAPVWRALPSELRGRFLVDGELMARAEAKGIDAVEIDACVLRLRTPPPKAEPGDGPTAFVVSIGDTKIARRLGYRRFVFMEHGAGQAYTAQPGINARNPSYAGGIDREDVGLFLVPNEYSAALWRAAYPEAKVEIVGCPKLDDLPARNLDGPAPVVAISFHWPAFVAPEAGNALGTFLPALGDLAKRYQVIGHAHPKGDWPERMERIYRAAGDRVRARLRRGVPARRRLRLRQQLDAVRVRVDRTAGRRDERRLMAPERPPRPALLGRRARRGQRRPGGPPRRRGRAGARGPRRAARGPLGRAGHRLRLPHRRRCGQLLRSARGPREAVAA
jgi:hypothetical protein